MTGYSDCESSRVVLFRLYSRLSGLAVSLVGAAVLAGWALDIQILKNVIPGFASMKANTALGFVFSGVALELLAPGPTHSARRLTAGLLATAVAILATLTLLEYVLPINLHIDQLLFHDSQTMESQYPGRMAPMTASNFVLVSVALLLIGRRSAKFQVLCLLILGTSWMALLGYAFSVTSLYSSHPYGSMAVHTALCFVVLALGLLMARPNLGFMKVILSDSAGGATARLFLPGLPLILFVLAMVRLAGEKAGYYDSNVGLALLVLSSSVVMSLLTAWMALRLHHVDIERQKAQDELVEVNAGLESNVRDRTKELQASIAELKRVRSLMEAIVESANDVILSKDLSGTVQSWNAASERLFGFTSQEALGRSVNLILPPDKLNEERTTLERIRRGEQIKHYETVRRRKDGTLIPVSLTISPIRDETGRISGASTIARDITEQIRAAENLRGVLEAAPDAIIVSDPSGKIQMVNAQTERLFHCSRDELVGQPVECLVPKRCREQHPNHRRNYFAQPKSRPMGSGLQLFGLRRDGTEFPAEVSLSPMKTNEGTLVISAVRDISERKQSEQRTLDSLREKDVLLREIHHRVKNNLAVVSSLFYLQSNRSTDKEVIRILQESRDRVQSMALVHETLYRSDNLAAVNFGEYLVALAKTLFRSYGLSDDHVQLVTDIEPMSLSIEQAIPCGLIVNELLSNALKHAFPDGRSGLVKLSMHRLTESACTLRVSDNGVGLPAGFDISALRSLGLHLVLSLADQLDGRFELRSNTPGTEAQLTMGVRHDKTK